MRLDGPLVLVSVADPLLARLITATMRGAAFLVHSAPDAPGTLRQATAAPPDLVVLDTARMELLPALRQGHRVPVIALTEGSSPGDTVRLLDAGADDVLRVPLWPDELRARVEAVLRRSAVADGGAEVRIGELEIDLLHRRVTRAGQPLDLTRVEWRLLHELALAPGRVVASEQLVAAVWGAGHGDDLANLHNWIRRLRRALGPDIVVTYPGIGYQLAGAAVPPPGVPTQVRTGVRWSVRLTPTGATAPPRRASRRDPTPTPVPPPAPSARRAGAPSPRAAGS
jgi:two-component system, OmpR family, KDP operon response regulator KdpE